MQQKGAKALSNLELLAVLLGSGIKGKDVFEVAKDILGLAQNDFEGLDLERLKNIDVEPSEKDIAITKKID